MKFENPCKISKETNGKNSITISFFEVEGKYFYSLQAILGNRAWAIWPHPDNTPFETILQAKSDAMRKLETWAQKNSLIKQFNTCLGALQPELFDFDE